MEESNHFFYVLHTADDTLYGGYTTDLSRRLSEHNEGVGAKYTRLKKRRPLQMIYAKKFATRSEATRAETAFKRITTRKKKEEFLKKHQNENVLIETYKQSTLY